MPVIYNDIEFKCEDALATIVQPVAATLALPLHLSLASADLEKEHICIIAEEAVPSQGYPRTGNMRLSVRAKVVTAVDQADGVDVRALHRSRATQVRDAVWRVDLPSLLSAAIVEFTVQDFELGPIHQRIVGRHWITEFVTVLDPVSCSDL